MGREETSALHIPIRKDLKLRLWRFIMDRYGTPRFHMREVVEKALEEYLDREERKR